MTDEDLYQAAISVSERAHVTYSEFPVGAAILTGTGSLFVGANVENASYPEGWCAETSAIAAMVTAGEKQIDRIAVYAPKLAEITPCGGCRQRIKEFATSETVIILGHDHGPTKTIKISDLLPLAFTEEALS